MSGEANEFGVREKNIAGEVALMNRDSACRGCAGSGLRFDFPAVARQIAELAIRVPPWIDPVTGRHKGRVIPGPGSIAPYSAPTGWARVTDTRWTLHDTLRTYRHLVSIGAEPEREPNFDESDACPWCHGTGKPQLSIHALEQATEGP